MIERIETGVRSSKIVKYKGIAYITGQVGEGETIQEQTAECLRRLDDLLEKAGSSREHMLRATIWLADMSDFAGLNEVWNAWVPKGTRPHVPVAKPSCKARVEGRNHRRRGLRRVITQSV